MFDRLCITALLVAGTALAQHDRVVPSHATHFEGSERSLYPLGPTAVRFQQVVHGSVIASSSATLASLAMRQDETTPGSVAARQIARLQITLGYSANGPGALSRSFAQNHAGPQKLVFDGATSLPPGLSGPLRPFQPVWKFQSPFFYLPGTGHLLLELRVDGQASFTQYFVDAAPGQLGGIAAPFGLTGPFASGDRLDFRGARPRDLHPGGQIALFIGGLQKQYPTLLAYGFSKSRYGSIPLPFDLSPLGAPSNRLYTSLDVVMPVTLAWRFGDWATYAFLPLPNDIRLEGLELYAQTLFVDPASNALGLVLSHGIAVEVGRAIQFAETLHSPQATSTIGTLQRADPIGVVLRFQGAFN